MESTLITEKTKDLNNVYNFIEVLAIPLILNKIFEFIDKDDIKYLSLCNKKIYKLYCTQIKSLEIKKEAEISNLEELFDKYDNVNKLYFNGNKYIEDFRPISKLKNLEILEIEYIDISDITFIKNNKKIKKLK